MSFEFVAVLSFEPADRSRLISAAAVAVLTWPELLTGGQSDDMAAVVFDEDAVDQFHGQLGPHLTALLTALAAAPTATAVVTTRPVTDTLKLVNAQGALTGTADREDHRFVRAPIATRLGLLRAVATALDAPTSIETLRALSANGAMIIAATTRGG